MRWYISITFCAYDVHKKYRINFFFVCSSCNMFGYVVTLRSVI